MRRAICGAIEVAVIKREVSRSARSYSTHARALSHPIQAEMVLSRIFIESQDRLFKRNATGMHVELLVHVPVDDVPRNPQGRVDLHRPAPALRIGIAQPPPLRVRFERAKDTRGLI